MRAKRSYLLFGCLCLLTITSCASKKPRDPNQTYIDEIKYLKKEDIHHFGVFTTRPVGQYHIDKWEEPAAIFVSFETANVSDVTLPKQFDKNIVSAIEAKSAIVDGKSYGQIWFYLKQDVDYTTKPTEYGVRVDLRSTGKPIPPTKIPEKEPPPETTAIKEDLKEIEQTLDRNEVATAEDLKELEEATQAAQPPQIEAEKKPPLEISKNILEKIERQSLEDKERVILRSAQAPEYHEILEDREIVIELKDTQLSEEIQPIEIEDPQSLLSRISADATEAPYPSAKVSLTLKESARPVIHQSANEIYIDFPKAPKEAVLLKAEEKTVDFGGYLASPLELPGKEISLHAKDTDLKDLLRMLAETGDYNIIMGDGIEGKANLRLLRVPWDQAFISILESHQLAFTRQNNIIRVSPLSAFRKEKEKAAAALSAKTTLEPLQILLIPLKHRKASEIKPHLYPLLSKRGSLTVDNTSNTLVMRDVASVLEQTKAFIASLDSSQ